MKKNSDELNLVYKSWLSQASSSLIKGQRAYKQASLSVPAAATPDDMQKLWPEPINTMGNPQILCGLRAIQYQNLTLLPYTQPEKSLFQRTCIHKNSTQFPDIMEIH